MTRAKQRRAREYLVFSMKDKSTSSAHPPLLESPTEEGTEIKDI